MSLNLSPLPWDLPTVTAGDTYPATLFNYDGTGTLTRVRMKIKNEAGTTALTLDSNTSGFTIGTSTSGSWAFTMSEITAATTAGLADGFYRYDMEVTSSAGVSTLIAGQWQILAQITD